MLARKTVTSHGPKAELWLRVERLLTRKNTDGNDPGLKVLLTALEDEEHCRNLPLISIDKFYIINPK